MALLTAASLLCVSLLGGQKGSIKEGRKAEKKAGRKCMDRRVTTGSPLAYISGFITFGWMDEMDERAKCHFHLGKA